MGVTCGKKDTRRNKVDCPPASAHNYQLRKPVGEQGRGAEDEDPGHSRVAGTTPQLQGQEEKPSDLIIKPKKLINPVRVSKSHQELHRELRMTHKRNPYLKEKPELQRVLEQRNWKQGMKQRREMEEKMSRTPLQQELFKRHQRLQELESLQISPEFVGGKESLRCTTILDVGKKDV
ncbi:hypothetical protein UPYG_G00166620 [Umbra pygmaea]|uniref:Actin-associated protein FAM107A n=1 Tax=Umbra pygmaea TaxID=75934 RepID=A0ABD0X8Q3_UMBPY